jgi:hypothetical protein
VGSMAETLLRHVVGNSGPNLDSNSVAAGLRSATDERFSRRGIVRRMAPIAPDLIRTEAFAAAGGVE